MIWLSLQPLIETPALADSLTKPLARQVSGVHVDLFAHSDVHPVLDLVSYVGSIWPTVECDLHVIGDRKDLVNVIPQVLARHRRIRCTYNSSPLHTVQWARSVTAGDIVRNVLDVTDVDRGALLITAPEAGRSPELARVTRTEQAVSIARAHLGPGARIVIDRDITPRFSTRLLKTYVSEVVVGKTILGSDHPIECAEALRSLWEGSDE